MAMEISRRAMLRGSLVAAGFGALGMPEWVIPALAQGETLVPFTDVPEPFNTTPTPVNRLLDIRKIDGLFTPRDQFFTTQHMGHPELDAASFRLKVTGLLERPKVWSLDELRGIGTADLVAGFECSGNSKRPIEGLASNGRWTGVPLRSVLNASSLKSEGQEVVFFGADHREEDVEFRGRGFKVDQHFGRSLPREQALSSEPFLAFAMNGEPLTRHQGFPLRLIMPGWYGVSNVKWLSHIHVQADRYLGNYQARWYRTLQGETIDGEIEWTETAITRMRLKSVVARVTRAGDQHKVVGFGLNDGTPFRSIEVRVDDGPWKPAALDPANTKYSWKLFSYIWQGATPGEHTIVSRAIDVNGLVQPDAADLENRKTFLEDNGQFPRKVMIA
jgi:DMSO/TMAO reductase YedYZ molybdopterin-dependent catalytic subunit